MILPTTDDTTMTALLELASILALVPLLLVLLPLLAMLAVEWDRAVNGERWEATLIEDPPNVLAGLWGRETVSALRAIDRWADILPEGEPERLVKLVQSGRPTVALATVGGYVRNS